jgi:CxxC motif-containing protein (DUF1111 family)
MELPQPVRIGLLCCAAVIAGPSSGSSGAGSGADDLESSDRGRSLFEQRWYVAPSALGPWGRGPTSNAEACADCHAEYGRGAPPETPDEPMIAMVLRLSVGESSGGMAPQPHPSYGLQLQTQGTLGTVPAEGSATIDWIPESVTLEDGTVVAMRRPRIRMQALAFGELGPDTAMSARIPPPLRGLGRLESIPDATLEALASRDAGDGIRGRINRLHGGSAIGRFGYKANVPSLREQVATALHEDLGLTSTMFPTQNCPSTQSACARQPNPPGPEIRDDQIDELVALLRALSVPPPQATPDAETRHGETLFAGLNCSGCHVPRVSPESPDAYTDLLLHDLGAGLADGRPEFAAGPRDWRTTPLWGTGAAAAAGARFLHDGRARTLEEAILWHGGEAEAARNRYARLPQPDRAALIRFLSTL